MPSAWLLTTAAPVRRAVQFAAPALRRAGGFGLGPDFGYILGRYQSLTTGVARQAFLRTLRAGVDLGGQVITMLDRCYLTEGLPTLIMWGAHDRVIPVKHAAVAHAAMPGSELKVFSAAGHFPHHDDPAGFAATVQSFMTRTRSSPYDPARWRQLRGEEHAAPEFSEQPHASSGS